MSSRRSVSAISSCSRRVSAVALGLLLIAPGCRTVRYLAPPQLPTVTDAGPAGGTEPVAAGPEAAEARPAGGAPGGAPPSGEQAPPATASGSQALQPPSGADDEAERGEVPAGTPAGGIVTGPHPGSPDPSPAPKPPAADPAPAPPASGGGGTSARPRASDPADGEPLELTLRATPIQPRVGDIVTVDVWAQSSTRIVDAPLKIVHDPRLLRFLDAEAGNFLEAGGASVVFMANGTARPGEVSIGVGRGDRRRGAAGSGILCRVRFEVLRPGAVSLRVAQGMAWSEEDRVVPVTAGTLDLVARERLF